MLTISLVDVSKFLFSERSRVRSCHDSHSGRCSSKARHRWLAAGLKLCVFSSKVSPVLSSIVSPVQAASQRHRRSKSKGLDINNSRAAYNFHTLIHLSSFAHDTSWAICIKGKRGSGKSALMNYALQVLQQLAPQDGYMLASFFDHGTGTELQRYKHGILRYL